MFTLSRVCGSRDDLTYVFSPAGIAMSMWR